MKFESADPSVVRSIKQRDLLNAWLRAVGKLRTLPALTDYQPDRIADEQADMMSFDVAGEARDARFLITHEGTRLTTTYGSDYAIGPERYARVVAPYLTCLMRKRPTYSVSLVQDPDGKDVSYERLLLPFGSGDAVGQIIGSYKSISIDGGFKIDNLMGVKPRITPVSVVNAVIDLDFVRGAGGRRTSGEVIELS